jgi:hypothetical protein
MRHVAVPPSPEGAVGAAMEGISSPDPSLVKSQPQPTAAANPIGTPPRPVADLRPMTAAPPQGKHHHKQDCRLL